MPLKEAIPFGSAMAPMANLCPNSYLLNEGQMPKSTSVFRRPFGLQSPGIVKARIRPSWGGNRCDCSFIKN